MISKKLLQTYNFTTINDYYNYIVESDINGQFIQVKSLIESLNRPQKIDFVKYLESNSINISKFIEIII